MLKYFPTDFRINPFIFVHQSANTNGWQAAQEEVVLGRACMTYTTQLDVSYELQRLL